MVENSDSLTKSLSPSALLRISLSADGTLLNIYQHPDLNPDARTPCPAMTTTNVSRRSQMHLRVKLPDKYKK